MQAGGSPGSLCKDNHRVEDQMNSVFSSLYPDLNNTPIEGIEGIGVKCIEGEVHEQEDQQGETPTPALRSNTTISHD